MAIKTISSTDHRAYSTEQIRRSSLIRRIFVRNDHLQYHYPLSPVSPGRRHFLGAAVASLGAVLPAVWQPRMGAAQQTTTASNGHPQTGRPRRTSAVFGRLRQALGELKLVDAHEHLLPEANWLKRQPEFGTLIAYARSDLINAGMPLSAWPNWSHVLSDVEQTWKLIAPYWPRVKHMGAGQLTRKALQLFFGVNDLCPSSMSVIRDGLQRISTPGVYERLMSQHNIEVVANVMPPDDLLQQTTPKLFAPLLDTSEYAAIQARTDVDKVSQQSDVNIYSLDTYLRALDTILEQSLTKGIVGIKWQKLAWLRDQKYDFPDKTAADRALSSILAKRPALGSENAEVTVGFEEMRPFQDVVQHHLVRWAMEHDLVVQIHTGFPGISFGGDISYTNPTHLTNLFLQYPKARFDLLHASYPYMAEATALTKMFPNVYITAAWLDELSPQGGRRYLREWLTSVATNKILAFGGDQFNPLLTCACAELMRDKVARGLTREVLQGTMSEDEALTVGTCYLRENTWNYFKLDNRWRR